MNISETLYTSLEARNLGSSQVKVSTDVCGKTCACSDVGDNNYDKVYVWFGFETFAAIIQFSVQLFLSNVFVKIFILLYNK